MGDGKCFDRFSRPTGRSFYPIPSCPAVKEFSHFTVISMSTYNPLSSLDCILTTSRQELKNRKHHPNYSSILSLKLDNYWPSRNLSLTWNFFCGLSIAWIKISVRSNFLWTIKIQNRTQATVTPVSSYLRPSPFNYLDWRIWSKS